MKIGDIIHARRIELGLTLEEVGVLVGVGKSTVKKWESGYISNMGRDKISLLAEALRLSPLVFITGKEEDAALSEQASSYPAPAVTDNVVTFPVLGEVAAGYDKIALEDWSGDTIELPLSYLHGRPQSDYFVLTVHGDSMYPLYIEGDKVLVQKADTLEHSGQIGVLLYDGENATLKRIEYVAGEDWLCAVPVNPMHPPKRIEGADLEQCRILGIPKLIIRQV